MRPPMSKSLEERYDPEVAERFIKSSDRVTGLPGYLGIRIVEAGPGEMTAELPIPESLLTPFGNVHGGVLSALCDHVLGCVCYPVMERGQWAATTEFKINLLAPVSRGTLSARAKIVSLSRTQAVVRIDVENEGRLAGIAQGTVTIRNPKGKDT